MKSSIVLVLGFFSFDTPALSDFGASKSSSTERAGRPDSLSPPEMRDGFLAAGGGLSSPMLPSMSSSSNRTSLLVEDFWFTEKRKHAISRFFALYRIQPWNNSYDTTWQVDVLTELNNCFDVLKYRLILVNWLPKEVFATVYYWSNEQLWAHSTQLARSRFGN